MEIHDVNMCKFCRKHFWINLIVRELEKRFIVRCDTTQTLQTYKTTSK